MNACSSGLYHLNTQAYVDLIVSSWLLVSQKREDNFSCLWAMSYHLPSAQSTLMVLPHFSDLSFKYHLEYKLFRQQYHSTVLFIYATLIHYLLSLTFILYLYAFKSWKYQIVEILDQRFKIIWERLV